MGNTPNTLPLVGIMQGKGLEAKENSDFYGNLVRFYEKYPPLWFGGVFLCIPPEISSK